MRQNQSQNNNINEANGDQLQIGTILLYWINLGKCVISGKIDIRFKIGDLKNPKTCYVMT